MVVVFPVLEPEADRIPKNVHFVWVGSPTPDWVKVRWNAWQAFFAQHDPSVVLRYWDEDAVKEHLPFSYRLGPYCPHPVVWSDYIRIEAVARYGGMYMDSDVWPLRPMDFLFENSGWSALGAPHWMNNGTFGFTPWHPFLAKIWAKSVPRLETEYLRNSSYCGPPVWTKIWRDHPELIRGLPDKYFFPTGGTHSRMQGKSLEEIAERYPDAVMFHEFEQSWQHHYNGHEDWRL